MRSLLSSNKAQFFVLSAVAVITILFLLSRLFEPSNVIDTSSVVLNEAPFIFENVKEKAASVINGSRSCEEAQFNLQEYKKLVEDYSIGKGYSLYFNYTSTPCFPSPLPFPVFFANVRQTLKTSGIFLESNYTLSSSY